MTSKETDAMWRTRSEQPEALRLAYWMDDMPSVIPGNDSNEWHKAAIELRRLHAVNTELLEALQYLMVAHGEQLDHAFQMAQDVITKATGEQA